jgi:hypothetical protein
MKREWLSITFVSLTFKVVDARIDARPGNSSLGLPASSFDTSFDNDKPASSSFVTIVTLNCVTVTFFIDSHLRRRIMLLYS